MARSQELTRLFQLPVSTAQRNYEVCRAYFVDQASAADLAQRFHLHVSTAYLFRLLQGEGLATKGQRCRPVPQPGHLAKDGSLVPAVADVQQLALTNGRQFATKVAGLFLFLPQLLDLDLPHAIQHAGWPGSEQIPPLQAFLALLLPKLLGHRRISHISDLCADEGTGLWAGLNVLPKTTYATDYSYRTDRAMHERLVAAVVAKTPLGTHPVASTSIFMPSRFAVTSLTWNSTGCRCATAPCPR
jgi:hypothetical protein